MPALNKNLPKNRNLRGSKTHIFCWFDKKNGAKANYYDSSLDEGGGLPYFTQTFKPLKSQE
jgi:hypothetical protein